MIYTKMKYSLNYLLKIFFIAATFLIIAGCSKLNTDIPPAPEISIHAEGILNPNSPDFHGKLVEESENGMIDCAQCHSTEFFGCSDSGCHSSIKVHNPDINDPQAEGFHGNYIRNQSGWDMRDCATCHNHDYSGGIASPSCLDCHTDPNGPEACNTCHGDFNNPDLIAPPRDINKNNSTDSAGVGAHTAHLIENQLGAIIPCSTCHVVPQNYYDPGHIDSQLPAEVIFSNIAVLNNGVNASYDYSTGTCSNTYCHGNWEFLKDSSGNQFAYTDSSMRGNNVSVVFNQVDGTQAQCGSCHNLAPDGHIANPNCSNCHTSVVDPNGNIIDQTKHVNGMKNVFGN